MQNKQFKKQQLSDDRTKTNHEVVQLKLNEVLLTRNEVSEYLKISLVTIHHWSRKGILRPIKIGTRIRFLKIDIDQILFGQITNKKLY